MKKRYIFLLSVIIVSIICCFIFLFRNYENNDNSLIQKSSNLNSEIESIKDNENKTYVLESSIDAEYLTGDIEELYNKYASVVVVADYIEDNKTEIQKNGTPFTFSKFRIKKVIKNESNQELGDIIEVRRMGGTITLQQLIDSRSEEFAEKLGVKGISREEAEKSLVKFFCDDFINDKNLDEHKTRLLMLSYDENTNSFMIEENSLGMLSYNEGDNTVFDYKTGEYTTFSFLK